MKKPKRSQPYYLTMRDACRARSALRALAAAGGQESAATPCTALTVASSALNISSGPAHTGFSSSTAATFEFSKPGERVVTNSTAADHALPEKYNELIMAVAKKWPGETRHQTALRYIQERERASYDKTGCAEIAKRTK